MEKERTAHHIDAVFVLGLFTIYAVTLLIVLYLGIESYQKLVARDEASYDVHLGTSYVAAKIHGNDVADGVKIGTFNDSGENITTNQGDSIQTLHLFQTIDGEDYDTRIYYYKGYLMELFTASGAQMNPEDGNQVMKADGLSFSQRGQCVTVSYTDQNGEQDSCTIALRGGSEVSP